MIVVAREATQRLSEQISTQLAGQIRAGTLAGGSRLPSIRQLAKSSGVSPSTVVTAFDRLVAQGLIEARPASGYFVSANANQPLSTPLAGARLPMPQRSELDAIWLMRQLLQRHPHLKAVGSGFLPEQCLEDMLSARFLARVARQGKKAYALACAPEGYPPLREQLALKLSLAGMPVAATQILTTFGASQGLDLVCRALTRPGMVVAIDEPGYFGHFVQLQAHQLAIRGIPRTAHGPDLHALQALCESSTPPRLFITQSVLHNPTGGSIRPDIAFGLVELARKYNFLLVEDDIFGDLTPEAHALRLAQLDGLAQVIYLGSFSKTLSPAIRVGFVAANTDIINALLKQKLTAVFTTSELDEYLVCTLLSDGGFHKHMSRLRSRLSHQRSQVVQGLQQAGLEPELTATGNLFVWAKLPPQVVVSELLENAYAAGFLLTPGDLFFLEAPAENYLRFNAAAANDAKLFAYLASYCRQ